MKIFRLVFSPIDVNTYILSDESGKSAIIDCGCYNKSEFSVLTAFLEENDLTPVLLLNTHCHLDHIFGNLLFLEKYGLRSYHHSGDEENRLNAVNHADFFGLEMEFPPKPQDLINDGQSFIFGSESLEALHVPGHSPGSIAFYSEKHNVIFTGDALFAGSIGRTDIPGGDHKKLIDSIKNRLFVLPPETTVYPGHGERTSIGREIESNPYFTRDKVF